jgi:hypothetical protein
MPAGVGRVSISDLAFAIGDIEMTATDKHRTATHESGHAVSALAMGGGIAQVSIIPGATNLGHCKASGFKGKHAWRYHSIDHVIYSLAGGTAELIQYGYIGGGCYGDEFDATIEARGIAREAGFYFCDLPAEEIIRIARGHAETLLRANWSKVMRLSFQLLRRGTIEFFDVDKAVEPLPRERGSGRQSSSASSASTQLTPSGVRSYTHATAPAHMRALFEEVQYRTDGWVL